MDKKKEQINNAVVIESGSENLTANDDMGIKFEYNKETRKKYYDDTKAKKFAKEEAFEQGDVFDPYTYAKLALDKTTAKEIFGNSENSAQADHIIPLENIHEMAKKNPFLKDEDIKRVANNPKNLKVLSQKSNQSKINKTPSEYIEYMQKEKKIDIDKATQRKIKMEERRAKASVDVGLVTHTAKNMGAEALTGAISAIEASAIPLALTLLGNIVQVCDGKKDSKQAVLDISNSVGAIVSTGAVTKLLKTALKSVDNPTLQTLLKHNLPAQIVSVAFLIKDDISDLKTKRISPQTATSNFLTKFSSLMGGEIVRKVAKNAIPKAVSKIVVKETTSKVLSDILVNFGGANVLGTAAAIYISECAKNLFDEVVGHGAWEAIKNSSVDCKETAEKLLNAVNTVENNFFVTDQCINSMISQHQEIKNNFTKFDKSKGE